MARIALVHGGSGYSRGISLVGAHHLGAALRHLGHDVVDLDADGAWGDALADVDAVLSTLFGYEGEEGHIPAVCDALGIPYLGSDAATCRLCGEKTLMKQRLRDTGVPIPEAFAMTAEAVRRYGGLPALQEAAGRLGYPVIVKPVFQSQGIGVHLVEAPEDLAVAVRAAFIHDDQVMVERYIAGEEVAVCLVGPELAALPLVEIRVRQGLFTIDARTDATGVEYVIPATADADTAMAIRKAAASAVRALGVRDLARVDVIVAEDGPYVLDVTPMPGLLETSATARAAAADGMTYERLVDQLVTTVLRRAGRETARLAGLSRG